MTLETLCDAMSWTGIGFNFIFGFCVFKKMTLVKGTRARYVWNALCAPFLYLYLLTPLSYVIEGDITGSVIFLLLWAWSYYNWKRYRDDDDFWGNLRKKIGKKIRSYTTATRLVPAHAKN